MLYLSSMIFCFGFRNVIELLLGCDVRAKAQISIYIGKEIKSVMSDVEKALEMTLEGQLAKLGTNDVDRAMEMTLEGQLAKLGTNDIDRAMEMTLEGQLAKMRTIEDEKTKWLEFEKLNTAIHTIPATKRIKIVLELKK